MQTKCADHSRPLLVRVAYRAGFAGSRFVDGSFWHSGHVLVAPAFIARHPVRYVHTLVWELGLTGMCPACADMQADD